MKYPSNYSRTLGLSDPFFGNVFDRFFAPGQTLASTGSERPDVLSPNVDIVEKDDRYELAADLPGYNKEDVDVEFNEGVLSIKAAKSSEEETTETNEDGYTILRSERHSGHYERRFSVGDSIDASKLSAQLDNGVLTVYLPKATPEKPVPQKVNIS